MKGASLQAAEAAKRRLAAELSHCPGLRGIGIAMLDSGFGIKVNLSSASACYAVPDDVDGVPVIVDIVGTARPL